jgi:thiol-disulfide isomerase/thioredoxin
MIGLWVLVGTLVVALIAGLALRGSNGRIRSAKKNPAPQPPPRLPELVTRSLKPATPVTLVQISTTFCAPCRHARAVFSALAARTEGLRHVEIDVTNQPNVVRELRILRTPTTLAFDPQGHELFRINGVPKGSSVLEALQEHLPSVKTSQ